MSFSESLCRTLLTIVMVVATVYSVSYIVNIEQRVTILEDRVGNSFMIPRPVDIIINRNTRGDDSK